MKTGRLISFALICAAAMVSLQSCLKDNGSDRIIPALVTIDSNEAGTTFQLNDSTVIKPTNIKANLYKGRSVRALVNFSVDDVNVLDRPEFEAKIFTIDTIRTKKSVPDLGELNDKEYGNDKIEIVNDWVSIGEDGYLTLRIRTWRYDANKVHYVNLVRIENEKDGDKEYTFELRHDACGDLPSVQADGIMAFDLNELAPEDRSPVTLHLKWRGFVEDKSANVRLTFRKK
ncbi:MAG: NigD-like protein [Bacteroidales bacterium]|nr:NigD-like protein [Bacteroidales bacterium]